MARRSLITALLLTMMLWGLALAQPCQYSPLWGQNGELWDPNGPLKDFSHVGYREGNVPIPYGTHPITYGPGRHVITKRLFLGSGQVLRGAGMDKTVLYFPKPLREIGNNECPSGNNNCYGWAYGVIQVTDASEVGIEDLTIEFPVHSYTHNGNYPGWNAINFRNSFNSWAKNVRIVNSDAGAIITFGHHITLDGLEVIANPKGSHYHITVLGAPDVPPSALNHLVTNFKVGGSTNHGVAGNWDGDWVVFSNGAPLPGTSGIRLEPDHNGPGTTTFLWSNIQGAGGVRLTKNSFAWNVGNQKLCPLDIHQAQLALRLGLPPPPPPPPPDTWRVNAGGGGYTDSKGNRWSGDQSYGAGSWGYVGGKTYKTRDPIANTTDDALYQSERYGNFSYKFDVPNGEYDVTLHFAEIYWSAPGKRLFDVVVEGELVLNDYDIYEDAGKNAASTVHVPWVVVEDGQLTIQFVTVRNYAKVSAIQVAPAQD